MNDTVLLVTENFGYQQIFSSKINNQFNIKCLNYTNATKKDSLKINPSRVFVDSHKKDYLRTQEIAYFFRKHLSDEQVYIYDFDNSQEELSIVLDFMKIKKEQELYQRNFYYDYKKLIEIACKNDNPILLLGETGVGKSYYAKYIHEHSNRKTSDFFPKYATDFSSELMQSELFGTKEGAFTGSIDNQGIFEATKDGTLLLDEIGELNLYSQSKLLSILETGTYRKIGSNKLNTFNGRLIFATNRDLKQMVKDKEFMESLYYRMDVLNITIPPLRERKDEIEPLALQFAKEVNKTITPAAMRKLKNYRWPGNIRELKKVIERAAILTEDEFIHDYTIIFY